MTMKTYKLLMLSLGALLFASCEKELDRNLTDVSVSVATSENVRYEGNIVYVKKGTPVQFLLQGDPDYISFFSGEIGHQYIYRNRTEISVDDIVSCNLKFSVWAQYGVANATGNSCKDQLDILYLSEEQDASNPDKTIVFPGMSKTNFEADSVLVEKETPWKTFIERNRLPQAPVSSVSGAISFDESVKKYIGKKLTLAIVVNKDQKQAPENLDPEKTTIAQSVFNFVNMRVVTKWKNGRETTTYASSFGFTPLNMKNKTTFEDQPAVDMPKNLEYGSVIKGVGGMWNLSGIGSGGFSINGAAEGFKWKYSWLVSDYLNLNECPTPDSGVKVKDFTQELDTYSYTYDKVGTYTATFLMNNANYAHDASKTCELIINVTE